jgi:hypothetical protein
MTVAGAVPQKLAVRLSPFVRLPRRHVSLRGCGIIAGYTAVDSIVFEVSAIEVIRWDDLSPGEESLCFSMRFVHAGRRRDHRVVRLRGTDVDERELQEAVYDFCDRVRMVEHEAGTLRLELWRSGQRVGSHRITSFDVGQSAAV